VAVPPGLTINLPIETVTAQLPFGAVKISFGELRQLAPAAFANSGGEHDHKIISLPLGEILPRLNPALLARRSGPKIEVAEEVNGPFGGRGSGVAFTTQPLKTPASAPAPAPLRMNPPAALAVPIASAPPAMQRAVASTPPAQPTRPISSAPVIPTISAAPAPAPVAPRPEPASPTIFASLWDLAETWPEELKNEISHSALANVSVPLAGSLVEAGLKRGRVTMAWKQLRTLAKPSSPPSPNDNVELDLPLKVIAPMFFAAQKNLLRTRPKAAVSEEIPNLFFGFPQAAPEPPISVPPKPVEKKTSDTNLFVWGDNREAPKAEENVFAPPPVPQTDFTHRQAPPKDVVARAVALPGVVGAVVTLPDGLRVASEAPAEFNADTLAAFIPQIFERMNQSAKELRMGALNNVSFTVGNVPWRIFRVNAVYFAAFGRAGESLPAAQLAALAGELDRKRTQ
jgi:predicted regulator of Ras-like GTPase activity (Roadblock/LC7/MglB family)